MSSLIINTAISIQKPITDVFEAIVNPEKMVNYFISESSGKMEEGKTLVWKFPEFETTFPIVVTKIIENQLISFSWKIGQKDMNVEINLTETSAHSTLVKITESEMVNDENGLNWLKGNTEGWANFSACLKAYLEYGINLRKGSFDHIREK